MRLGKELSILLIAGMLSTPILGATEMVTETGVTMSTQVEQPYVSDREDEEMQFIRQHGEAVNISIVEDNMKLTVEYMLADTYTAKFLISVEKLDGVPFKVRDSLRIKRIDLRAKEEIEQQEAFEALPKDAPFVERLKVMAQFNKDIQAFIKENDVVDMEGLTAYLQEPQSVSMGTNSAVYGMCQTKENTDSKVYFTYEGTYGETISGEMVMSIDSIIGEVEKSEDIAVDLVSYLNMHQSEVLTTKPNIIDEEVYQEKVKQTNEEVSYVSHKEEFEGEPKRLLVERGLAINLIEGNDSLVIDNIGFIDGQLHILMLEEGENRYRLEVYDEAGELVSASYHTGHTSILEDGSKKKEEYRVFDIDSVDALSQYTFKVGGEEVVEEWRGPWELSLDMSKSTQSDVIKVDQVIPYATGDNARLKEIHIGQGSLALVVDQIESKSTDENLAFKIKFKDGNEIEFHGGGASHHTKDQAILVYSLNNRVGEDIKAIEMGNKILYSAS